MLTKREWEASIAWSKVVAGCVIRHDDSKFLMVQEAQERVFGLWNIHAGHVDVGEEIEHVIRQCGTLKAQIGEILDVKWLSYQKITDMKAAGKLRREWIYDAITRVNNVVTEA